MKRRIILTILSVISLFMVLNLACKQSGEIITPAEATQRFDATQGADSGDVVLEIEGAEFAVGTTVELTFEGHLVGLYKNPNDTNPFTYATRGDQVTVAGSQEVEGEIWYKVETMAGDGWLLSTNIKAVE
jgi:hypothetical protein